MNALSRNSWRSRAALLTVSIALLGMLYAPASDARSEPTADQFSLSISVNEDRSDAMPLSGTGTRLDGDVAVFLDTSYEPSLIRSVTFFVNGKRFNLENRVPYDLGSTWPDGDAQLVETDRAFEVGPNNITAVVRPWLGSEISIEGTLNVLPDEPTIVEIAGSNDDFSILVEALVAADLVEAVNGPGPITVFAPTNDAFVQLLSDLGVTKEELFADTELLTTVLTYHVLGQALFAEAVVAQDELTSVQGEPITVNAEEGKVNDSNLIALDIAASNGVIHVVDAVLLPPSITDPQPTIAEIAASDPQFSILVEAVVETGLVGILSVTGPEVTVFAPTNDAFIALLDALGATKEELFDNKPLLTTVLLYHLVNEELFAADVLAVDMIYPMESEPIAVDAHAVQLNGIDIVTPNIDASNGVIHAIDGVLVPPAALKLLAN